LPDLWAHPDGGLTISSDDLSIIELSRPSHGLAHALGASGRTRAYFMLEKPTNLIRVMIPDSRFYRVSDFVGIDANDKWYGATLGGTIDRPYIEIRGVDMVRVYYYNEVYLPVQLAKGLSGAMGCAYIPSLYRFVFVESSAGKISAIDMITNEY